MLKLADFWHSVRLSWLIRLSYTKSVWGKIHREEAGKHSFCPVNSNFKDLETARKNITDPVCKEICRALLKCRNNMINMYLEEFLNIPINKKTDITSNFTGIQQGWSKGLIVYQILDNEGNLQRYENLNTTKKPLKMEYGALQSNIRKKLEHLKTYYNDEFCMFLHKVNHL